ncbi:MAG: alcohol dehydrogenase catalytic domain-containing protein [Planctomycetes bacterium]|nr:alcohol dehydrogenase catalytic domain-containing protein [Planctomycetota bacterium]
MKAVVYKTNAIGWPICRLLRHLWPGCQASRLNGFSLREVPPPSLPGPDWAVVRTRLGGICGTDTAIVGQKQPPDSFLQDFSSQPFVPGHENVATVEQTGPDVDADLRGRRVLVEPTLSCRVRGTEPICTACREGRFGACENFSASFGGSQALPAGTSAGYCAATGGSWGQQFLAHRSQLVAVPEAVTDEKAICVDTFACSLHGVLQADLTDVRRVLVYGAGIIGLAAVGGLRALGFDGEIDILGRSEFHESFAIGQGASDYIRLPDKTDARYEVIAKRTGGTVQRGRFGNRMLSGGYDLVLDCIGSPPSMEECLKWTRAHGQVVLLGTLQRANVDLTPIWFRELRILGAYGRAIERVDGREVGTYQLVLEMIRDGRLTVEGLLTHTFAVEDYRRALMTSLHKSASRCVKAAFDFRE